MMPVLNLDPRLYVILGIVTTAAAQISLKRAGLAVPFKEIWYIFVVSSMIFYVMSFVSYYFAMRNFDISTVQPIMMVSIVALITLYGLLAGESFNYFKLFGIIIACFSIILILKS